MGLISNNSLTTIKVEEFKEYNINDIWKLRKKTLLISPTGKIYAFDPNKFNEQILEFLHKKDINIDTIIDKICEEVYQRGIDIERYGLTDIKHIIINFFGFIIYDYSSSTIQYPMGNNFYDKLTEIQLKILSKLCRKKRKDLFHLEGEDINETKKGTIKDLCYYKRKITKKRFG